MGLSDFFKSETHTAPAPQIKETPWAPKARGFLESLYGGGLGMSSNEQAGQGILADILAGKAFVDPSTSQLYQGLRQQMLAEEERGLAGLRRRQQAAGMFYSGPGNRAEGEFRNQASAQRMGLLGGLYEQERMRDNPYTRMAAVDQYGGLQRDIDLQEANVALQLLGYQPWYQPQQYTEPSTFSQIAYPTAALIGAFTSGSSSPMPTSSPIPGVNGAPWPDQFRR